MSSSDSEEDLERFKESVDSQFLTNDLYNKQNVNSVEASKQPTSKKLPSLRYNRDEEDQSTNVLKVTPEFQKYVSKSLSAKLDKDLELVCCEPDSNIKVKKRKPKGGVKLFSSSEHFIKVQKLDDSSETQALNLKHKQSTNNYDEDEVESKCKLVAVSGSDILSKHGINSWSNRSKAEVFNYKKSKKGPLEYQEKPFEPVTY